jgi:hypothetical protein
MSVTISQAELKLLTHLYERSGTFGDRIGLDPKPIIRDLRISMTEFDEASAALAALGLCGRRDFRPDGADVPSHRCSAVWVTSKGAEYLAARTPCRGGGVTT